MESCRSSNRPFGGYDPHRAVLSGLTSILFLILWFCSNHGIEVGHVIIHCDNISALNQVFTRERSSNNPLRQMAADIDLITCARGILLPVEKKTAKAHSK